MQGDAPVSWIMFFTLAAGILLSRALFIRFLHSQRNRDIAANALAGDNSPRVALRRMARCQISWAWVFAVIVMGLLAFGYSRKSSV